MRLNDGLVICICFIFFSFIFAANNLVEISLSDEVVVIGQEIKVSVNTYIPNLSYVYADFDSGESYFLNKLDDNNWQAEITIPEFFREGIKALRINFVVNTNKPEEIEKLKYLFRNDRSAKVIERNTITLIQFSRDLLIVEEETLMKGTIISYVPERVQPNQKMTIFLETPQILQKASVVYNQKTYPMIAENDLRWSVELNAAKAQNAKIYYVDKDNQLYYKKVVMPIIATQQYTTPSYLTTIKQVTADIEGLAEQKDNFKIRGNKTIVFINKSKDGDIDNFIEEHKREESLNLDIAGRESSVNVEAKIFSTTQENVDKKEDIRIKMYTDQWEAYLGDFAETISDNQFTLRDKNLSGFKFSYFPGKQYFMFLNGNERGFDRDEYLYGNDSQGPYYLQYIPVVIGSEKVFLDGVLQQKDQDYLIEYQSGKITFRNNVVQKHQIIRVIYETENSVLKSKYTALRYKHNFDWLQLGTTAIHRRDPDNLDVTAQSNTPQDRKIYDLDAKIFLGNITLDIEEAQSQLINDIRDSQSSINISAAHYAKFSYDDQRVLKFSAASKRTDDEFAPIGNKDLKQGLNEDEQLLELNVSRNLILRADNFRQSYQEDVKYYNQRGYYKFYRREDDWPEVRYWVKEQARQVEAIATDNVIQETYYRGENVELSKLLTANIRLGLTGSKEFQKDTQEFYPYKEGKTYGSFIKTEGLRFLDLTIGSHHQESEYLSAEKRVSFDAQRDESYSRLNIYPNNKVRFGLEHRDIKDSYEGNSEILDLDYIIYPAYSFRTVGQYTIASLKEVYVSQDYRVQKQKGAFGLKWLPNNSFKANIKYNPNISIIRGQRDMVNSFSEVKNANLDYLLWQDVSLKYNYLCGTSYTKEPESLDNLILQSEDRTESNIYILKFIPYAKVDVELKYRHTDQLDNDINDVDTANIYYTDGRGYEIEKGMVVYTRFSRQWLVTFDLGKEYEIMDYRNEPSINIEEQRERYGIDGRYKLDRNWTFHLFGSYLKTEDLTVTENNITYEYSPGVGLTYRLVNFKFNYDYTRIESFLAEESLRHKHVLGVSYDFNRFINFLISAEHINSEKPNYKTTDVLAKFSATF